VLPSSEGEEALGESIERGDAVPYPRPEDFMRTLGLETYVVGGAVRDGLLGRDNSDEDFVVRGVALTDLRRLLARHGEVEELEVGREDEPDAGPRTLIGLRFYPAYEGAPEGGFEVALPRREVSTGKGRHDFAIVVDPDVEIHDDAIRRDFTFNALYRRLGATPEEDELIDPLGGAADLEHGRLRVIGTTSFRDDGLRILRGVRFVSQLGVWPEAETERQMQSWARRVHTLSGERIRGEISKLLLGKDPADALRLARDTGVLAELSPELAPMLGFDQESRYHALSLDGHTFDVVQWAADHGCSLAVRMAGLFHDAGKPESAWRGDDGRLHYYENPAQGKADHAEIGAAKASEALTRWRYPTDFRLRVIELVKRHMWRDFDRPTRARARRFLHRHGELVDDLVDLKRADLASKGEGSESTGEDDLERVAAFARLLQDEVGSPHRISDLAINGDDLLALGIPEGRAIGACLRHLLGQVIGDPELNSPDWLRAEAGRWRRRELRL